MKILVPGTAGFIGYHLAKKFLERGEGTIPQETPENYKMVR